MNALDLLKDLVERNAKTTQRKDSRMLREAGKWAFVVPAHFDAAIGVDKHSSNGGAPTQGALFSFQPGDMIYDHQAGYNLVWAEALQHVRKAVQVIDATPVAASRKDEVLGCRIPREPGQVNFVTFEASPTGLVRSGSHSGSQDDFVAFLITGTFQPRIA